MAGIYFHIPYCKKKCNYCSFFVDDNFSNLGLLTTSLIKEIHQRKAYLQDKKVKSIYLGGGTPSLLPINYLYSLLNSIYKTFEISNNIEITLEGNPEDLNIEYLEGLKNIGINRLSIGVQSFQNDDLEFFTRQHNADQAEACIKNAMKLGFKNISIDLMYGFEKLNLKKWETNLIKAVSLPIQHLSVYHLSIDKGTKFHKLFENDKIKEINEKQSWQQFILLIDIATKHDFKQYEISNFCKNGFESFHNSSYWKQKHYLGIGPSAHSYNGESRQWNIYNVDQYVQKILKNKSVSTIELLSNKKKYNEYIMLNLRTSKGINLYKIKQFGNDFYHHAISQINKNIKLNNLASLSNENVALTKRGMFLSNTIILNFFKN